MAVRTSPGIVEVLNWSNPQPSIPISSPGETHKGDAQADCLFLTKLPRELRLLIYEQVITSWGWSDRLHIENPWRRAPELHLERLSCRSCRPSVNQLPNTPYYPYVRNLFPKRARFSFWDEHQHCHNDGTQRERCFSFLFSCRSIYFEAIDLVYSSFSFDLVELEAAYRFLSLVPQRQLNQIRSLQIAEVEIPGEYLWRKMPKGKKNPWPTNEELWLRVCSVLKTMPELQMLQITFLNYFGPIPKLDGERALLKSLDGIHVSHGRFVVQVPWRWKTNKNEVPGAKFAIDRREPAADVPGFTEEEYRARHPGPWRKGVLLTVFFFKLFLAGILLILALPLKLGHRTRPAWLDRIIGKLVRL